MTNPLQVTPEARKLFLTLFPKVSAKAVDGGSFDDNDAMQDIARFERDTLARAAQAERPVAGREAIARAIDEIAAPLNDEPDVSLCTWDVAGPYWVTKARAFQAIARSAKRKLAALSSIPGDGWLPIETVLKDGTPVILGNTRLVVYNARWLTGAEVDPERCGEGGIWAHLAMTGWKSAEHVAEREGCGILTESQFTHWRPCLPPLAPPAPSAPERTGDE